MAKNQHDPPRPPGRPRVDEPGTSVSTWLKPSEHDKLIRLANKKETSISGLVRQLILQNLP